MGMKMLLPAGYAAAAAQVSAAALIRSVTSAGCEAIATWLDGTSMVVAPILAANWRSASGGMAWSCVATRYQVGSDFHAGTPVTSANVEPARAARAICFRPQGPGPCARPAMAR